MNDLESHVSFLTCGSDLKWGLKMKIEFNSQVFVGNKRGNLVLKFFGTLVGAILVCSVGIKILVGDFNISDISGIIVAMFIIGACNGNRRPNPQYVSTLGNIEFEKDKMTITYMDINGGKNVGLYSEFSTIQYDEIESIEYGKELNCFRIVGKCLKKRNYMKFNDEKLVSNGNEKIETFMYVMDLNVAEDILDSFEKYIGIGVKVLE